MDPSDFMALGVVVVLVALAGFLAGRLRPAFDRADADAIRDAVSRQINAFLTDDASVAFSCAAPRLQRKYRSGNAFIAAMKTAYRPIYRPLAYRFGELVRAHTGPTQLLHVTGPQGIDWIVSCYMEEQPGKEWRIAGFHIRRAGDRPPAVQAL